MAASTKIEWAANADGSPGATWNPVRARRIDPGPHHGMTGTHCVHASEGCRNCYAERWNNRALPGAGAGLPYAKQSEAKLEIFLDEKMLAAPLRRRKPTTWFLSSMSDVFADFVTDAMLDRLFAVMALAPQHTFIVLTKRAKRMRAYFRQAIGRTGQLMLDTNGAGFNIEREMRIREASAPLSSFCPFSADPFRFPLPNVWLGVSAEDQKTADERTAELLATPAAIRFLSAEPLLRDIEATPYLYIYTHADEVALAVADAGEFEAELPFNDPATTPRGDIATPRLDWVIVGGESGPGARPMHPAWARSLRDQCAAAGVPFFFKQWGEWMPGSEPGDDPKRFRVGKARAGRLLDGVEHNARPPLHEVADGKGEARLPATGTASPGRSVL